MAKKSATRNSNVRKDASGGVAHQNHFKRDFVWIGEKCNLSTKLKCFMEEMKNIWTSHNLKEMRIVEEQEIEAFNVSFQLCQVF